MCPLTTPADVSTTQNTPDNPDRAVPQPPAPAARARRGRPFDLRRRQIGEQASRVLARSGWLPPDEQVLIRAIYERHEPLQSVAALLSVPSRTLRRRVRRITSRLLSEEFAFVSQRRARWNGEMRALATACFLEGRTVRRAARQLGISYYHARSLHAAVLALLHDERMAARASASRVAPSSLIARGHDHAA